MYNVVYIDVDRIDDDFQASKEVLGELNTLVNNIKSVNPEDVNCVVLISNKKYQDIAYKLNLLQTYFVVQNYNDDSLIMGPAFTSDAIAHARFVTDDNRNMSLKMYSVIENANANEIEIDNILSITHGLDFGLFDKTNKSKHIAFTENHEEVDSPIEIDTEHKKNITYLLSSKEGLKGYNDCFNTYFDYVNCNKLSR